jgi:small ligand-binding sensory domain FIST
MPLPSLPTLAASAAVSTQMDTRTAALEVATKLVRGLTSDGAEEATPAARADAAADLVLLFGSFHHRAAFSEAAGLVSKLVEPRCIVGVTAEWVVGPRHEVEGGPGLSALAMRLPGVAIDPVRFDPFDGPTEHWSLETIREKLGAGPDAKATLLFADPFSLQTPVLLKRIAEATADHPFPIIGGLASGSSQPGANVLVLDRTLAASGAVGVTLSGPIAVDPLVSPGCRPVGRPFIITKAKGNVIEELGGRPALDVARETIGALPDDERIAVREGLLVGFAVSEYRDRFGRSDFLLRGVLGADTKRNTLIVGDRARVGRTVQFFLRDRATAVEDLDLLLDREQVRELPFAVLMATCGSRGRKLFRAPHVDARHFARRLGDPPLAGLFAAGEIGPLGAWDREQAGRSDGPSQRDPVQQSWLHGHTVAAALFRREDPTAQASDDQQR